MKRRRFVQSAVEWSLRSAVLPIALSGASPAQAKRISPVEKAVSKAREYLKPGLSAAEVERYFRSEDYNFTYYPTGPNEHVMIDQYRHDAPGLDFVGAYNAQSSPIRFVQLLGSTTSVVVIIAYMGASRQLLRAHVRFDVLTVEILNWW